MYKKKRSYKKKPYVKRPPNIIDRVGYAVNTAQNAVMMARNIKKMLNVEFKVHNASISYAESDDEVNCLSLIAQGDGEGDRNGNSIRARSLTFRGEIRADIAGNVDQQAVRLIVVLDKDGNGVQNIPTGAGDGANGVLDTAAVTSLRRLIHSKRYIWLMDKTWYFDANRAVIPFKKTIQLDHILEYIGVNADTTSASKNRIWAFTVGKADGANIPGVGINVRLRYVDN